MLSSLTGALMLIAATYTAVPTIELDIPPTIAQICSPAHIADDPLYDGMLPGHAQAVCIDTETVLQARFAQIFGALLDKRLLPRQRVRRCAEMMDVFANTDHFYELLGDCLQGD